MNQNNAVLCAVAVVAGEESQLKAIFTLPQKDPGKSDRTPFADLLASQSETLLACSSQEGFFS